MKPLRWLFLFILLFLITGIFSSTVRAESQNNLESYSLSIDPIHNWWPTPGHNYQQIDAALWKDSDGENVKNFSNLKVEWKFDPNYYELEDASSNYYKECPVQRVGSNRACIRFSAHVKTLQTGNTDVQLTLTDQFGTTKWNAERAVIYDNSQPNPTPMITASDLSTYSISFESDPIRKWWPVAPNQWEDITGALWKDSDGTNVKKFTNLQAEWKLDPEYFTVAYTSSQYFDKCPVQTVNGRPCIYFYASVRPNKLGNTSVTLKVSDNAGGEAWNAYPIEIYNVNVSATPHAVATSQPVTLASPKPTPMSTNVVISEGKDYKNLEQKVVMLETKLQEQDLKLSQTQTLLDKIVAFLKSIFHF